MDNVQEELIPYSQLKGESNEVFCQLRDDRTSTTNVLKLGNFQNEQLYAMDRFSLKFV